MIALLGDVYTPLERIEQGIVLVEGDAVVEVGRAAEIAVPRGATRVEAEIVAPGFIDLQINGAFGRDFSSEPKSLAEVAARLPSTGVTAFLPSLITAPRERLIERLRELAVARAPQRAARPLGVHLEGPFLNARRCGAHDATAFAAPRADDVAWMAAGNVRLLTLAPEIGGALDLARACSERNIAVAAGHTDATLEQAEQAIEAGIGLLTHVFNAMSPMHHRTPGIAGAFLATESAAVCLIADGVHVHPAMVEVVRRCKRPGRLVLVTDAMAAAGMPPGRFTLAGQDVIVDETSARLADGTLAGSTLTMDAAVRNFLRFTHCEIAEALAAATLAPARAIGEERRGRIAPGCAADLVLLDRDLRVTSTLIAGTFAAPGPRAAPSR